MSNFNIKRVNLDKIKDIENTINQFKGNTGKLNNNAAQRDLEKLKKVLDAFFSDCKCENIIYTINTDKMFFGMSVMPIISSDDVQDILFSTEKKRITGYMLEIDSKLLSPTLNLSSAEITAVILHEIGHLTNNTKPVEELRHAVNSFLAKNNEYLILSKAEQYRNILAFGIKDSLKKLTSLFDFNNNQEEILADEFVVACGYADELESALKKINKNSFKINKQVKNKLLVLKDCLRLYKDVRLARISAIHTLKKGKAISPSVLQKKDMDMVINSIRQIDDDRLIIESKYRMKEEDKCIYENSFKFPNPIASIYRNIKIKGLRSLDEDFYELSIRVKNVDEEPEALSILRSINTRLSILDDYLKSKKLDDYNRKKAFGLIDKYQDLRDLLSKKSTYKDKYYGLFVQTPTITSRFDL